MRIKSKKVLPSRKTTVNKRITKSASSRSTNAAVTAKNYWKRMNKTAFTLYVDEKKPEMQKVYPKWGKDKVNHELKLLWTTKLSKSRKLHYHRLALDEQISVPVVAAKKGVAAIKKGSNVSNLKRTKSVVGNTVGLKRSKRNLGVKK